MQLGEVSRILKGVQEKKEKAEGECEEKGTEGKQRQDMGSGDCGYLK